MKKTISLGIVLSFIIVALLAFRFCFYDDEYGTSHLSAEADNCCILTAVPVALPPIIQKIAPSYNFSSLAPYIPVVIQHLAVLLPMSWATGRDSPPLALSFLIHTQGLRAPPQ